MKTEKGHRINKIEQFINYFDLCYWKARRRGEEYRKSLDCDW